MFASFSLPIQQSANRVRYIGRLYEKLAVLDLLVVFLLFLQQGSSRGSSLCRRGFGWGPPVGQHDPLGGGGPVSEQFLEERLIFGAHVRPGSDGGSAQNFVLPEQTVVQDLQLDGAAFERVLGDIERQGLVVDRCHRVPRHSRFALLQPFAVRVVQGHLDVRVRGTAGRVNGAQAASLDDDHGEPLGRWKIRQGDHQVAQLLFGVLK